MSTEIRGLKAPDVSRQFAFHWDRHTGITRTIKLRGTLGEVTAQAATEIEQADKSGLDELDIEQTRQSATLILKSNEFEDFEGLTWEVIPIEMRPYLEEFPLWSSIASNRAQILIAKRSLDQNRPPDVDVVESFTTEVNQYVELRKLGVTNYLDSRLVLRKTETVKEKSAIIASYDGRNKVEKGGTASPTLPPDIPASLIGTLPALEWLKRTPNIRISGSSRFQIVQEWWGAVQWSEVLYEGTLQP